MDQWLKQVLMRAVANWMMKWWADMFPSAPIVIEVKYGKLKSSDMARDLSLKDNPAVFLQHAEQQRDRLQQERIACGNKGKVNTYEIFESQLKASMRVAEIDGRKNAALMRAAQADHRRHNIEPARIYLSCWHLADKRRAFFRIRANMAFWQYDSTKWTEVDSGGPAGIFYRHEETNQVLWDPPPEGVLIDMERLLRNSMALDVMAEYADPEEMLYSAAALVGPPPESPLQEFKSQPPSPLGARSLSSLKSQPPSPLGARSLSSLSNNSPKLVPRTGDVK